jgi:hypothetical protein
MATRLEVDFNSPIDINNFNGEGILYAKDGQFYLGILYVGWSHADKNFYDNLDARGNPLEEPNAWKKCPINGKPEVILDKNEQTVE